MIKACFSIVSACPLAILRASRSLWIRKNIQRTVSECHTKPSPWFSSTCSVIWMQEPLPALSRCPACTSRQSIPVMVCGDLNRHQVLSTWIISQAQHHVIKIQIYVSQWTKLRLVFCPPQRLQWWDMIRFNVAFIPIFTFGEIPSETFDTKK